MRRSWKWLGVAGASGLAGASMIWMTSCYDFQYGSPGPDGSISDTGTDVSQGTDAGEDAPKSRCPSSRGPNMVEVSAPADGGTFCIDSTEVTRAQYAEFLAANPDPAVGRRPPNCDWNQDLIPGSEGASWPDAGAGTEQTPVSGLDWCDAYAYCTWAGKSLCGDTKGGAHRFSRRLEPADASTDRWRLACTHAEDGKHAYPYGNTFQVSYCNGRDAGFERLLPVGSLPKCVGGFPGLVDMSGNVNEWEDSCDDGTADSGTKDDLCVVRGGSFHHEDQAKLSCFDHYLVWRWYKSRDVGFRCCQ